MKKKKIFNFENIFLMLLFLVATFLFLKSYVTFTFDSAQYYYLSLIIKGEISITSWASVRGPSFPLIIYLFTSLFGQTMLGLKIGLYIFYISMCYSSYFILKKFLKNNTILEKIKYCILLLLLIIFNPLVMSYSHALLTEALMPFILLITIIINLKLVNYTLSKNKTKFIILFIYNLFITVFVWFLKQPYVIATIFVYILSYFLTWLKNKSLIYLLKNIAATLLIGAWLLLSIIAWNSYLDNKHVDLSTNGTEPLFSKTIISGMKNNYIIYKNKCNISYIQNNDFISKEDKDKLLNLINNKKCDSFDIYEVYNTKEKLIDTHIVYLENNRFTTKQAINFLIKNTLKRPLLTIDSYHRNYMSTLNLYTKDINTYYVNQGFNIKEYIQNNEICNTELRDYGIYIFERNRTNFSWEIQSIYIPDDYEYIDYIEKYRENNNISEWLSTFITKVGIMYIVLYIISFLILPILLIYSFIKYLKNKHNIKYFYTTLLFGISYINLVGHVLMGCILDRYMYPCIPLVFLGIIILFIKERKSNGKK